jgi:hypothetical protein
MKRTITALSMFALLAVAACQNNGSWTPMSSGRTAGEGQVVEHKAEKAVQHSLTK